MAVTSKTQNLSRDLVAKAFADYGYKPTENDLIYWVSKPISALQNLSSNLKARRLKEASNRIKTESQNRQNQQKQESMSDPAKTASRDIQKEHQIQSGIGKKNIYNLGKYGLVKFQKSPTVFLVDFDNKELRPFLNEQAFNTAYDHPEEAWKSINIIPEAEYDEVGGALNKFKILKADYGIGVINGQAKFLKDPDYRVNNISKNYGEIEDHKKVLSAGDKLFDILSNFAKNNSSKLDPKFINRLLAKNPDDQYANDLRSLYIGAIAYGHYTLNDIYKDLKKRELIEKGDKSFEDVRYIDDTLSKERFMQTDMGKFAARDLRIAVPTEFVADNPRLWNRPITDIDQEAFRDVDIMKRIDSPEFKAAADKIQSDFHDILEMKLGAETEAQKQYADYQYDQFMNDIEKQYGIRLSSNATTAWGQLENLFSTQAEAGLAGSGIEREQIDDYLKNVRKQQDVLREQKLTDEEKQQADFIRKFGSEDQIRKLDEEDRAKGLPQDQWRSFRWGLKPNAEFLRSISTEELKKKFPNLTDEQINAYRDQMVDKNGNFRSELYKNKYKEMYDLRGGPVSPLEPYGESKKEYQQRKALEEEQRKYEESKREFRERENPYADNVVPQKEGEIKPEKGEPEQKTPPKSGIEGIYGGKIPDSWKPSEGKVHIPSPDKFGDYTGLEKDPYSDKWYGAPKQQQPASPYQQSAPAPKKATLYGPGGQKEVVDSGSVRASELQKQGWGLKPGSYKVQEMITGYKDGKPVQVPKGQYVPGVSLTPPNQQQQQKVPAQQTQQMITGYKDGKLVQVPKGQYVPGVSLTPPPTPKPTQTFPNVQKNVQQVQKQPKVNTPPAGATYISNPGQLKGLKESQIWRDPSSKKIYKLA